MRWMGEGEESLSVCYLRRRRVLEGSRRGEGGQGRGLRLGIRSLVGFPALVPTNPIHEFAVKKKKGKGTYDDAKLP